MHTQTISFDTWADIAEERPPTRAPSDHGENRITWGQHPALGLVRIVQGLSGSTVSLTTQRPLLQKANCK